jgi:muramoyltetrapeptide carboxypeptidase
MKPLYPPALRPGDQVRVIAPARSLALIGEECRQIARERFEQELGLKLTFGKNVEEKNDYISSSVESRLADLHEAFADKKVKAIFTVIGGFNSEELLGGIDWSLIKRNPKVFCGFSDITVLSNSIYAKTGLVSFVGPHYSSLGMKRGAEYTIEQLKKALMGTHRYQVLPSANWSDDSWYLDQDKRTFLANHGLQVVREGGAVAAPIVGGNLSSLALLFGSPYMPRLDGSLLFIEDCEDAGANSKAHFMSQFGALTRQPGFEKIRGLLFGRFQKNSALSIAELQALIGRYPTIAKRHIPVVAGADFGHTTPIFTFGIGGTAELEAAADCATLHFEPFVKA